MSLNVAFGVAMATDRTLNEQNPHQTPLVAITTPITDLDKDVEARKSWIQGHSGRGQGRTDQWRST